jgi:hypothetical protein
MNRNGKKTWFDPATKTYYDSPDAQTKTNSISDEVQKDKPVSAPNQTAAASTDRSIRFEWKSGFRELPLGNKKSILDSAPDPQFAHWLAQLLAEKCTGLPLSVPPFGYSDAQRQLRVNDMRMVFTPIKDIQNWCKKNGLFDLSALIVKSSDRIPGNGHYCNGSDCSNAEEWQKYVSLAIYAVKEARTNGLI